MSGGSSTSSPTWEKMHEEPTVRRFPVPGGWLYQVENPVNYWCTPTFVPNPDARRPAIASTPSGVLCIVEDGVPVAKSDDYWRGFVRGLTDLRGRLFGSTGLATQSRHIDGGMVKGAIDELAHIPTTRLTSLGSGEESRG